MSKYKRSDVGNAELFAEIYSHNLRFDNSSSPRWLYWKDSNHRWVEVDEPELMNMAIASTAFRFQLDPEDDKERAFAIQSGNLSRLYAITTLARGLSPIYAPHIQWDSNPFYLATPNGLIDLPSGKLLTGDKYQYVSRGISTPYNETASAPRWLQFIDEITVGNKEIADFLQRAVGYTLTASIKEQVFFLLHGKGGNGKGVFINTIGRLMEKFSTSIRFSSLEENPRGDAQRDLAELVGVRAAFSHEGAELKVLDTSIIKSITGGDIIRASRKYEHPFTFVPQFKLWLSTNHIPKIVDDSDGFWRRVIKIPFLAEFNSFGKRDNNLEQTLAGEMEGILVWAVEGAKMWWKDGLKVPDILLKEIILLRSMSDEFEEMVEMIFTRDKDSTVRASEAYTAYMLWAMKNNEKPMTITSFGRKMSEKFPKKRDINGAYYEGIRHE